MSYRTFCISIKKNVTIHCIDPYTVKSLIGLSLEIDNNFYEVILSAKECNKDFGIEDFIYVDNNFSYEKCNYKTIHYNDFKLIKF